MMKFNLKDLHKRLKVASKKNASSSEAVTKMKKLFGDNTLPDEYISFITQASEVEISIDDICFIRIWGAEGVIEMNNAYHVQKYIPGGVAIGDDEGGSVILYAEGENGYGLYKTGFGDLDIDDSEYIADSLRSLLLNGDGIEKFIE